MSWVRWSRRCCSQLSSTAQTRERSSDTKCLKTCKHIYRHQLETYLLTSQSANLSSGQCMHKCMHILIAANGYTHVTGWLKITDMKVTDQMTGHEIAGHETSWEAAHVWGGWIHWVFRHTGFALFSTDSNSQKFSPQLSNTGFCRRDCFKRLAISWGFTISFCSHSLIV